jgi:hypothetical protein
MNECGLVCGVDWSGAFVLFSMLLHFVSCAWGVCQAALAHHHGDECIYGWQWYQFNATDTVIIIIEDCDIIWIDCSCSSKG